MERKNACKLMICDYIDPLLNEFLIVFEPIVKHEDLVIEYIKKVKNLFLKYTCGISFNRNCLATAIFYVVIRYILGYNINQGILKKLYGFSRAIVNKITNLLYILTKGEQITKKCPKCRLKTFKFEDNEICFNCNKILNQEPQLKLKYSSEKNRFRKKIVKQLFFEKSKYYQIKISNNRCPSCKNKIIIVIPIHYKKKKWYFCKNCDRFLIFSENKFSNLYDEKNNFKKIVDELFKN